MYESRHFLLELLLAAVMGGHGQLLLAAVKRGHERRWGIEEVK